MKTKFYWVALLASAAMIAQAKAGGFHGGGGGFGGGVHAAPVGGGGGRASSFASHAYFGGGRMMYARPGFSSMGARFPSTAAFQQRNFNPDRRAFAPRTLGRTDQFTRSGNDRRFVQGRSTTLERDRAIRNGTGQMRSGNNLSPNWRNHVVAQHSGNWHRDWDRRRDHFFNGHRCRFINGQWFIFDFGFDPYDYWYTWPYPYGSYPYGSSTYDYNPYFDYSYDGSGPYYEESAVDPSEQDASSVLAAAQEQLAQQGYYRGDIDGIFGPATRSAISRYQGEHHLDATGQLNPDTLRSLGLSRGAHN